MRPEVEQFRAGNQNLVPPLGASQSSAASPLRSDGQADPSAYEAQTSVVFQMASVKVVSVKLFPAKVTPVTAGSAQ